MAANRAQYNNLVTLGRSTNNVNVTHWHAKLHTNKATHLDKFKLDDVVANVDASGTRGYCGVVKIDSPNLVLHAPNRRGAISVATSTGPGIMLQDGGLNIKSLVSWIETTTRRANIFSVKVNINIPYYNYDVQLQLHWDLEREGVPVTIPASEKIIKNYFNIASRGTTFDHTISIKDSNRLKAGDELTFTLKTLNEEGLYEEVGSRMFIVQPALVTWTYNGTYASYARDYPTATYDLRSATFPIYEGTTLYLNDIMGTTAGSGFYADDERWYELDSSGTIIALGYFGQWPAGDPLNPYPSTAMIHHGYRNNTINTVGYLDMIDYSLGIGWDAETTIYRGNSDNLYYVNVTTTTLVSNGYYVFPYGGGDYNTLLSSRIVVVNRLVSGAVTETWFYDTMDQSFIQQ